MADRVVCLNLNLQSNARPVQPGRHRRDTRARLCKVAVATYKHSCFGRSDVRAEPRLARAKVAHHHQPDKRDEFDCKAPKLPARQELCGSSGTSLSLSAMRPSSGSDPAFIFCIALLRCTFTVASAIPISCAICLLRRPRAT